MKRIIPLIAALMVALCFCLPAPLTVHAEESGYAVAPTADVWFYGEENEESKLFCIPRTYYVKIVRKGEPYSAAEYLTDVPPYQKLTGYCQTSALQFVSFTPERPYLYREVTAAYVLPGAALGNGSFSGKEETFVYYGTRTEENKLYFYVGKNGVFDYIPAQSELSYELNTDYLQEEEREAGATPLSALEISVIVLSSLALLAVAVLIARGKRAPESEDF